MRKSFTVTAFACLMGFLAIPFSGNAEDGNVILNPSGEKNLYQKTYVSHMGEQSEAYVEENAEIVIDNNNYYFRNFLNENLGMEDAELGYVLGKKIGSRVWIELPQTIVASDEMGTFNVTLATYDENIMMGFPGYVPVEGTEEIMFTIEKDGSLTLGELPEGKFLIIETEGMNCTPGIDGIAYKSLNSDPGETVITNPEGEKKDYNKEYVITMFGSNMTQTTSAEIVFNDNGDVYFKDMLSQYGDGEEVPHYYVKGTLEGKKITVNYPQLISDNYGDCYIWLGRDENPDSPGFFVPAAESGSFTLTVADNGIITLDKLASDEAIINITGGMFDYCAEIAMEYVPVGLIPDGVEAVSAPEMTKVEYYDLSGQKVSEPAAGLLLKKVKYSDGSIRTFKEIVR